MSQYKHVLEHWIPSTYYSNHDQCRHDLRAWTTCSFPSFSVYKLCARKCPVAPSNLYKSILYCVRVDNSWPKRVNMEGNKVNIGFGTLQSRKYSHHQVTVATKEFISKSIHACSLKQECPTTTTTIQLSNLRHCPMHAST